MEVFALVSGANVPEAFGVEGKIYLIISTKITKVWTVQGQNLLFCVLGEPTF